MKKENRKLAIKGWESLISKIDAENIVAVPSDIYLEGGDVIVDGKTVYVGISERTGMAGVQFLQETLGNDYIVVPLKLKPKFLHLDVVFTIIASDLILVYKDGLEEESYKLLAHYKKIEVSAEEQFELATNVLVVAPRTVIMNSAHTRIRVELEKLDFRVVGVPLSETAKDGGAFRCTTCPLERGC